MVSTPVGTEALGPSPVPLFTAPCLLQSPPGVSRSPRGPLCPQLGAQVPILSTTLRLRDPSTASTTLLGLRVLRDILNFINLMMQNEVIPKHFCTCVQ